MKKDVYDMSRFHIPANNPEDWRPLLAKPDKHWKTGYSAKTLAYCWMEANGFPRSVRRVFSDSDIPLFQDVELLLAFPEYRVPLRPYRSRPAQNDIFILARGNDQLIAMTVEGKVDEPFGELVAEWKQTDQGGKKERLSFLRNELELDTDDVDHIRYQLLHRAASAIIETKKFRATNALMLVHSFGEPNEEDNEAFQDYCRFLDLFGANGRMDSLVLGKNLSGIDLYFAWVNGERKYLDE